MLPLRGVKSQLGLKPLRRNLTLSVYSDRFRTISTQAAATGHPVGYSNLRIVT